MLNYWLHSKGPCGRWWEQGAPVISSKHTVQGLFLFLLDFGGGAYGCQLGKAPSAGWPGQR